MATSETKGPIGWRCCPVCMGRGDHEMGFYGGGSSSSISREQAKEGKR